MEKLSRSQRYANLRDSITADREENTTTQDLSQYQNRLNGVEDSFIRSNPATQYTEQPVFTAPAQPVYQAPQQPVYQAPVQPQYTAPQQPVFTAPVQPAYQAPAAQNDIDSLLSSLEQQAKVQPVYEAPAQPAYTAPAVQNDIDSLLSSLEQQANPQPVHSPVQPQFVAPQQPVYQEPAQPVYQAPVQPQFAEPEQPAFTAPAPEVNPVKEELSLDDFLNSIDFGTETAAPAPVQPVEPVVNAEPADGGDPIITDSFDFDSFINQTLTEVDDYNKEKGLTTMDQISQNIITEIQNEAPVQQQTFTPVEPVQAPVYTAPVIEPVQITEAPSAPAVEPAPVAQEPVQNSFVDDFLSKETVSMEHPVAYQTLEENKDTEPVEIVNLAELEKTESLTKTVTFAPVEEETETDVDTPNKVLNVLLVVLIVALFLVLGFVVYELISANII